MLEIYGIAITSGLNGWRHNVAFLKPPDISNFPETKMPVEVTIHVQPIVERSRYAAEKNIKNVYNSL